MVQPGAKGPDTQKDKQLGQWIYRNADQLGRGGNGTVYQARSEANSTVAAVKILSPQAAKQADRAGRFDTEIRALNELRDPGVLPLIDQYDPNTDAIKWYAMPIATPLLDALAATGGPSGFQGFTPPDSDPITTFTRDPQPEIEQAASNALLSYALLTLDGQWIQRDRLGPFASPQPDETTDTVYARQATAYLEDLDEDCVIVRLLCHG